MFFFALHDFNFFYKPNIHNNISNISSFENGLEKPGVSKNLFQLVSVLRVKL